MMYLNQVKEYLNRHKETELAETSLFVKGIDGEYLLTNDKNARMAGISFSSLIGKTDRDLCWRKYQPDYCQDDVRCIQERCTILKSESLLAYDDKDHSILTLVHHSFCKKQSMLN